MIRLCALLIGLPGLAAAQDVGTALPQPDMLRWGIGLGVVFLALGVTLFLMRRMTGASAAGARRQLRVVASLPIGVRERLLVVQVGEQQWVLGVGPGVITRIGMLEGEGRLDSAPIPASFQDMLHTLAARNRSTDSGL